MTPKKMLEIKERHIEMMPFIEKLHALLKLVTDVPTLLIKIEALQNKCKELEERERTPRGWK
jgi:uncharacterized spore protein YtfJ